MPKLTIPEIRAAFQKLADEQPTDNVVRAWALIGVADMPAYAVERLAELLQATEG